jgi:hypothetical protein
MRVAAMMAAHLCTSEARKAANSCDVPPLASAPSFFRVTCMSADRSPSLIAALSLSRTARGVPAGASMPDHKVAFRVGKPLSVEVGIAGSSGKRAALRTASGRIVPASICASRTVVVSK